jgi:two-component system OmpR family response regulator
MTARRPVRRCGVSALTRVLLVEDDEPLARGVAALLRDRGHAVDHVTSGQAALELIGLEPYGLVVLDVGLPDMSGFEVLRRIRRGGEKAPVLILTARDAVEDRVTGLDSGADDYLLKPFDPAELEARVRALVRRSRGDPSPTVVVGNLVLDTVTGAARIGERPIDLRRREAAVLACLAARAGRVVPKDRIAAEVFAYDDDVAPNALELYIARLRKKLQPDGPQIRTLRGLGYMLEGD